MNKILQPKWLFYIAVLPVTLLFLLVYADYHVIETMLKEEVKQRWMLAAGALFLLTLVNLAVAVLYIRKKTDVPFVYWLFCFVAHTVFLSLLVFNYEHFFEVFVPRWMMNTEPILYVLTFLMPQLAWSFMAIVIYITPQPKAKDTWINLGIAVIIPALLYTIGQIALPLMHNGFDIDEHVLMVLFIIITIAFLLFLTRAAYLFFLNKNYMEGNYRLVIKLILTILLPIMGLSANSGRLLGDIDGGIAIFGDFDSAPFYLLAVFNGILLSIPNPMHNTYRLLLFVLRGITFSFSLYFFLVFLPFLPFSLAAVLAFGLGFLMLTPLIIFLMHLLQLHTDFLFLQTYLQPIKIWLIVVASFLVIPVYLTFSYMQDRNELQQALHYVYSPDYNKSYRLNHASVVNTLHFVEQNKNRGEEFLFTKQKPFLSAYYNLLVLDNLTLSDKKLNKLRNVFSSANGDYETEPSAEEMLAIHSLKGSSVFDEQQHVWKSTISLEIKKDRDEENTFITHFNLPDGAYIDNYSLLVGNKMKHGILAEKKTALWVFRQIQNENRDPGILYYTGSNRLCLRVFPVAYGEIRKTQFTILHKEPFIFQLRNKTLSLGTQDKPLPQATEIKGAVYIPAALKQSMPVVPATYQYCLLVDAHTQEFLPQNIDAAEKWLNKHPQLKSQTRVYAVNSMIHSYAAADSWKESLLNLTCDGGYFTGRAQTIIYRELYKNKTPAVPVFIIFSLTPYLAVSDEESAKWESFFPEKAPILRADKKGDLYINSFEETEGELPEEPFTDYQKTTGKFCVFTDKNGIKHLLLNNNKPSVILTDSNFNLPAEPLLHSWDAGVLLQAMNIQGIENPHMSAANWSKQVKQSFSSQLLTTQTAFMVVETEAQQRALLRKQKEMLQGRSTLDAGEEPQAMSEPSLYVLALFIGIYMLYSNYRKTKKYVV